MAAEHPDSQDGVAPAAARARGHRTVRWRHGLLWIASLALFAALLWLWFGWHPLVSEHRILKPADQPTAGGDFLLQSAEGPVRLADFRGKLVLLYFGYTACPDVCPTNLALLGMALRSLTPREREHLQVIFVSVDPQRDDPRHLKQYAEYFHPDILGLTGSADDLAEISARYGAVYRRSEAADSAMGYLIDHSAATYVIGPDGHLIEALPHATPSERMAATIRNHLAQSVTRLMDPSSPASSASQAKDP